MNTKLVLTDFFHQALRARYGIVLQTENAQDLRWRLAALRANSADPDLKQIAVVISRTNPEGEVWLVKKDLSNGTK